MLVFLCVLALAFTVEGTPQCVSSCSGMKDGDYQSCIGCGVYATCMGGALFDNRPCAIGLSWDDSKKYCDYMSATCNAGPVEPGATVPPGVCVGSCKGMKDGLYQSCESCGGFVQCHVGNLYKKRCQTNLEWNDKVKMCDHASPTCHLLPKPENCVSGCAGVDDGFYAACSDCTQYIWCSQGMAFKSSCPANSVWDSAAGTCMATDDLSCSKIVG